MVYEPKKDVQITIRLTEELHTKIIEESIKQKRKKTNMITVILEDYFDSIERLKKIAEKR